MYPDRLPTMYVSCAGGTSGVDYNRKATYLMTAEVVSSSLIRGGKWILMCVLDNGTVQLLRLSDNRILILEPPNAVS